MVFLQFKNPLLKFTFTAFFFSSLMLKLAIHLSFYLRDSIPCDIKAAITDSQYHGVPISLSCYHSSCLLINSINYTIIICFSTLKISFHRSLPSDFTNNYPSRWRRSLSTGDRERSQGRERKGWMVMIHDLSGSPVAAASMITPFVPSPGSDRVSRSNPGAWLILRPNGASVSVSSWKPWGRLEAWRERGSLDGLGYKVDLFSDNGPANGIPIAEGTMSVKKGGHFCIDSASLGSSRLPGGEGFVMGSSVGGEGKVSKPVVQVGARHVTCMADAALFIALSAAIDLSMDACRLFSRKLRKELCHDQQDSLS